MHTYLILPHRLDFHDNFNRTVRLSNNYKCFKLLLYFVTRFQKSNIQIICYQTQLVWFGSSFEPSVSISVVQIDFKILRQTLFIKTRDR